MHDVYRFSGYLFDCRARELRLHDRAVAMPARVFECLQYLIEHRDRAVGRDELAVAVFARDNVSDAQLSQIVLRARRSVGDDGQEQRMIRTVPRFGFRWVAETMEVGKTRGKAEALPEGSAGGQLPVPAVEGPDHGRGPLGRGVLRQRSILGGLVALALVLTLGAWWAISHRGAAPVAAGYESREPTSAVAVLPMHIDGPDEASWARLGLMDFIADRLRRDGLPVASSESVLSLLHGERDSGRSATELRRAVGDGWIVTSRARLGGPAWRVELAAEDRGGLSRHADGEDADLLKATDQAVGRLLAALGRADHGAGLDLSLAERLQRAQAALLGNELDTARRILEDAPSPQREDPELRLRRAQVEFRAGHHDRARKLLAEVLHDNRASGEPTLRARALLVRGGVCVRLDCHAEGERDYSEAIGLIDPDSRPALLGEALNGRGVTRFMQGRFDEALDDLGRARILLSRSGDSLSVARVDANLGFLEKLRGRPSQAVTHMERTVAAFRKYGAVHELVAMHTALAETHLQLLEFDLARESIERAWSMRERITDETQATNVALGLAEVMIRQGELEQALEVLERYGGGPLIPADLHRADVLRTELAWRSNNPGRAMAIADAALADWEEEARPDRLARLQMLRLQAMLEAEGPMPESVTVDTPVEFQGHAWGVLLEALGAHVRGEHDRAGPAYRASVARAERDGVPEELAAAVAAHAAWAIEQGVPEESAALVGRIAPWASQDFDLALLHVQLHHDLGQTASWELALQDAQRLAGQRTIPPELLLPPD